MLVVLFSDQQPLAPAAQVMTPTLFERTWNSKKVFLNACEHWILNDLHSEISKKAFLNACIRIGNPKAKQSVQNEFKTYKQKSRRVKGWRPAAEGKALKIRKCREFLKQSPNPDLEH